MTKFDHNQICTPNNEVSVGDKCQYYEDGAVANVTVLADESNDKGIGFRLHIDSVLCGPFTEGAEFSCWAALGRYAYNGMWRLYGPNEYGETLSRGGVKPHKGRIKNWRKLPCSSGLGYYIVGTFLEHPDFGEKETNTSWVVVHNGSEIETRNSRYTLIGDENTVL